MSNNVLEDSLRFRSQLINIAREKEKVNKALIEVAGKEDYT